VPQLRREWVQSGNSNGSLTMTGESLLQFVVPAILAIVWLIRLEGRINLQEKLREELKERINGFEQRIWDKLDVIEALIHKKVDK